MDYFICDHSEGCHDFDCPHRTFHEFRGWIETDDPCDGMECGQAIFGSECVPVEEIGGSGMLFINISFRYEDFRLKPRLSNVGGELILEWAFFQIGYDYWM